MDDEVPARIDPRLRPYIGYDEAGPREDPLLHFYVCKACGQPVDRRDLGAVFHHDERGHVPLADEDAMRLLSLEDRPRLKLLVGTTDQQAN